MNEPLSLTVHDRLLVVAPHPDDETLATGVLIQRAVRAGAAVRVLLLTDGDNNPWIQRVFERRWHIGAADRQRFAVRRRAEAMGALAVLGVDASDVRCWGLRDQGLTTELDAHGTALVTRLADEIVAFAPTWIACPSSRDRHPDHNATAVLVALARARLGDATARPRVLGYLAHPPRGTFGAPIARLRPTAEERGRKRTAIACHASQRSCHRWAFDRAARRVECYFEPVDVEARAPVRIVAEASRTLWLEVGRVGERAWLAPRWLHLLVLSASSPARHLALELDWRRPHTAIRRRPGGVATAVAQLDRRRCGGLVRVPRMALGSGTRVLAKVAPASWMFDRCGWCELVVPTHGAVRPLASYRVCAVIPCFDVAGLCGVVVREALRHADRVIAVDDGSTDGTAAELESLRAEAAGRLSVRHLPQNRGKGAALLAGFQAALTCGAEVIVTLDGDGQHRPRDIPALVEAWRDGAELVIGERTGGDVVPLRSRIGQRFTRAVARRLLPGCPADTQSGFRAFDRRWLEELLPSLRPGRYETELDVLVRTVRQGHRVASVPIPTIYLDGNRRSHFRPLRDSLRVMARLLAAALRRGRLEAAPVLPLLEDHLEATERSLVAGAAITRRPPPLERVE